MAYQPITLNVFDTFILLRRLNSIKNYIEKNNIPHVLAMLEEIIENLNKPDIVSDIIDTHRDFISGYLYIIIYDIRNGVAPYDVLVQYICEVNNYILQLTNGMIEVQTSLRNERVKLPGLLNSLPIELREIIADKSVF